MQISTLYFCSPSDIGKPSCCGFLLLAQVGQKSQHNERIKAGANITYYYAIGLTIVKNQQLTPVRIREEATIQRRWAVEKYEEKLIALTMIYTL